MAQAAWPAHIHQALETRRGAKHTDPIQICATPHMPILTYHIPTSRLSLYAFDHSADTSQSLGNSCLKYTLHGNLHTSDRDSSMAGHNMGASSLGK